MRDEEDWRKLGESIDSMLFWCGGRVFGCRAEDDRVEFAIEPAEVPIGRMFRYVTVPYALHFNRSRDSTGPVFKRLRTFRVREAFRTEFVLWLHRPLSGVGWTADAAYQGSATLPWIDARAVLEQLGRGPGALREYRLLRARGIEDELVRAFASPSGATPGIREVFYEARALRKRQQQVLLRSVVWFVARHCGFPAERLPQRSRARPYCAARALVTLVGVRCGVALKRIGELLARDQSTLQGTVLTLRARDPRGLLNAAEAILAEVQARRGIESASAEAAIKGRQEEPENSGTEQDADGAGGSDPLTADRPKGNR
ncbi:MAG: hypothetical protein ACP5P4_04015 [Steroidobacteraceae bacterium]